MENETQFRLVTRCWVDEAAYLAFKGNILIDELSVVVPGILGGGQYNLLDILTDITPAQYADVDNTTANQCVLMIVGGDAAENTLYCVRNQNFEADGAGTVRTPAGSTI